MEKENCNCFTCRHRDEPRVVAGYLQGYIDASDWFINWAEKNKIKLGSIADDDLGGIYAQMKCNRDESGCLLEDFPDLEKPIENLEAENQRLKEQLDREIKINRKMKSALEVYATGKFDPNRFEEGDYAYATDIRSLDNGDLAKEVLKEIDNKE